MSTWREELHPRDKQGEFAHGAGWVGQLSDRIGTDVGEVRIGSLHREKQGIKLPHPESDRFYGNGPVPNSDLTPQDREVVYKYAWDASNFERMNGALRGNPDQQVPEALANDVTALTSAIGRNHLKKPTIVYRGMPDTPQNRKLFSRASFVDNGFMSTSTDPDVADLSADPTGTGSGIIMRLRVPTGARAVSIGDMFDSQGGFNQDEILLQRGGKIRIISKKQVGGVFHVEAELISQGRP